MVRTNTGACPSGFSGITSSVGALKQTVNKPNYSLGPWLILLKGNIIITPYFKYTNNCSIKKYGEKKLIFILPI